MPEKDKIIVYTDGGSLGNPGPGGYGAVIKINDDTIELTEGLRRTTNNRMEMLAAVMALRALPPDKKRKVVLHTDSRLLHDTIEKKWIDSWQRKGWRKSDGKPVLNKDIWQMMLVEMQKRDVEFRWVKAHAGIEENERCDELSKASAAAQNLKIDHGYEAPCGEGLFAAPAAQNSSKTLAKAESGDITVEAGETEGRLELRIGSASGAQFGMDYKYIDDLIESLKKLRESL
ncbi:MAG: ribonuclease HI [Candidatus Kapaibacterium sp.]